LRASKSCTREIHFILPQLAAGQLLSLKATIAEKSSSAGDAFAWHDTPGDNTVLRFGTRPVLRYHYEAFDDSTPENRDRTMKVFHHVFSPKGDVLTTGGVSPDPNVHSPHHRGIFFGYNRIRYGNGRVADTWHGWLGAYQAHHRFLAGEAGPVLGRHRAAIGWYGADKRAFAKGERELTVYHVPGGQLIEFASRLNSRVGPLRLDGDPQHSGVHCRAHNEVFAKASAQTTFIRPDGVGQPGETRNWDHVTRQGPVNLPWNAMSFVLGSQRYTVAYLDHPRNPKEARKSEREYGRFGTYFEYTVDADHPLSVNYRFWLQEGMMTPEQVASLSSDFVDPAVVTVQVVQRS
jgi:hypothetical protein